MDENGNIFVVPDGILSNGWSGITFVLNNKIIVSPRFDAVCPYCNNRIKNVYAPSIMLVCECGKWINDGEIYGQRVFYNELRYSKFSKEEIKEKMDYEISCIKEKYEKLFKTSD